MEWVYGVGGTLVVGWVSWISWEALGNHGMRAQMERIEDKLDRLIERFL